MAIPKETVWERDPHTEAKHRVLGRYYDAFFPIMLATFPRLTVFDGYAGPGEYSKGEEGSPLIALRKLLDRHELVTTRRPVRFIFVEEREDRLAYLQNLVSSRFRSPGHIRVDYHQGSCEDVWEAALTSARAWGQPIFANLDPFGAGVPYRLVERLGANRGSEVLVTFMSDWLRRFATLEHLDDGDRQFGSREWRKVAGLASPLEKELFLVEEYRRTLARAGLDLCAPFRLADEGGRAFYLIYATAHMRGLERMKEAMWKTDPVRGIEFRDPQDPAQGVLDLGVPDPDLDPLCRRLLDRLGDGQPATVEELRQFALAKTAYRDTHVPPALRRMIEARTLRRDPERGQLSRLVRVRLA